MAVLNIISYGTLFVVAVVAIQVNGVPIDPNWILNAQNSIEDSLSKVESYGVENEKVKTITNEAFDTFTKFAENSLSEIIKEINNITSDELLMLKSQLMKWSDGLERLNKVPDATEKTAEKAVGKFLITMDVISKEIVGFAEKYNFESLESKRIVEKLESLLNESVSKLVEYAKSVEDQVSGISKVN